MTGGIEFVQGQYGKRAVLRAPWNEQVHAELLGAEFVELELNQGKGWRGDSVSFLESFPALRALDILDFTIKSVESVHLLHELRELTLSTYCKTAIRFGEFPQLIKCAMEWRPRSQSLFTSESLEHLFVNRYDGNDIRPFSNLSKLKSLTILSAPITDINGLGKLKGLTNLRIGNLRRLESLAGLDAIQSLESLTIDTCRKITSIAEVGKLRRLRRFSFANGGRIESLKPLAGLSHLEWLFFIGSTDIVDGDLSPLMALKELKRVGFMNRRHYTHTREDFPIGAA